MIWSILEELQLWMDLHLEYKIFLMNKLHFQIIVVIHISCFVRLARTGRWWRCNHWSHPQEVLKIVSISYLKENLFQIILSCILDYLLLKIIKINWVHYLLFFPCVLAMLIKKCCSVELGYSYAVVIKPIQWSHIWMGSSLFISGSSWMGHLYRQWINRSLN